jgi:hypothetical protein
MFSVHAAKNPVKSADENEEEETEEEEYRKMFSRKRSAR